VKQEPEEKDSDLGAAFAQFLMGCLVAGVILAAGLWLFGCTSHNANLTPAQIAATRPAVHPITNVETLVSHAQKALFVVNVPAFIVALAALGLVIYGLISSDKALERIGFFMSAIAGVIAAGTLVGMLTLPFLPWVVLSIVVAGAGYSAYLIYNKFFVKKTLTAAAPVVQSPAVEPTPK
jgi:hypothetical protein